MSDIPALPTGEAEQPSPHPATQEPPLAVPEPQAQPELPAPPPEPPTKPEDHGHHEHTDPQGAYLAALALGALGVVYGDIGTSPLYAMRESFHGMVVNRTNVLGILSLIVWALILVVTVKYVMLILRADNHGEGGMLALTSKVQQSKASKQKWFPLLMTLGLFGTALLYGDGMITPAISVLSAVEGLEVAYPELHPFILPITITILTGLFFVQSGGTAQVGKVFGPITLVWFATLAALGLYQVVQGPEVLVAFSPHFALQFLTENGLKGFLVLGSVFLVATGGEALYADMGHFGRKPIRIAWFWIVFPALLMNYFGQGSLLLRNAKAAHNPFFQMMPPSMLVAVVLLATAATVIASQALISGAYSLTMQAIRLNYLPRLPVKHTSATERGQIYVSTINWVLWGACILLVLGFRTSSNLAAAYGVGVNLDMLIATTMFFVLVLYEWNWPFWKASLVCGSFLIFETCFLIANSAKVVHGGWFPLVVGGLVFTLMTTWKAGRLVLGQMLQQRTLPLKELLARLETDPVPRIPGLAAFMYGNPRGTPPALLSNLRHNRILHETVLFLAVEIVEKPYYLSPSRHEITEVGQGFYRAVLRFGYMDKLNVPAALSTLKLAGEPIPVGTISFFLGKETLIPKADQFSGMSHWREHLFAVMVRNATDATAFFQLPPDQVVELGTQLEI